MALTYAIKQNLNLGSVRGALVDITFDASYPTGGEVVDKAALGFAVIHAIIPVPKAAAGGVYTFAYNPSDRKLSAYWGDYTAAADGPHVEVAATTNLATVVVQALVLGAG